MWFRCARALPCTALRKWANLPALRKWANLLPALRKWANLLPSLRKWANLLPALRKWANLLPSLRKWANLLPALRKWANLPAKKNHHLKSWTLEPGRPKFENERMPPKVAPSLRGTYINRYYAYTYIIVTTTTRFSCFILCKIILHHYTTIYTLHYATGPKLVDEGAPSYVKNLASRETPSVPVSVKVDTPIGTPRVSQTVREDLQGPANE